MTGVQTCALPILEKILKAYYTYSRNELAPYSHSLSYLAKKANIFDEFSEEQKDFIDQIEPLNIEARYLSYKERLLKSLNEKKCLEIIRGTKIIQ